MSIEANDIIVDVNFTDNLNVDNNSGNESVWYSSFYRFIYRGYCLVKRICCKKKEDCHYEVNEIEDLGERTSGFNTVDLFPPTKSFSESLEIDVTVLQCPVTVHSPKPNEETRKNLDETNKSTVMCHDFQLYEIDEASNTYFIRQRSGLTHHLLTPNKEAGECLAVNVDSENISSLDELFPSKKNEDNEVQDIDEVNDVIFSGMWIQEILTSLVEQTNNDWVWNRDLHEQLSILLMELVNNEVKLFLVKNNFLSIARVILNACDQSWMNGILIDIIINICCNDKAIDFVGRDEELVIVILKHFKYRGNIVIPGKILELLSKIVDRIKRHPQSPWAKHVLSNEFLGANIIGILHNTINDDILIAERLIRLITEIVSLHNFSFNLFSFELNALISGLLTCFIQVIPNKEEGNRYYFEESAFVNYWLILIINIKGQIFIDYRGRTFLSLMDVIYRILKSYNETYLINPGIINMVEIRQNLSVIYHSVSLLSMIHTDNKIPKKVDRIVLNITYHLNTIIPEFDRDELLKNEAKELLDHLILYWICKITKYDNAQIFKILYPCEPEICECILNLIRSNFNISSRIHNRIHEIENCLKSFVL